MADQEEKIPGMDYKEETLGWPTRFICPAIICNQNTLTPPYQGFDSFNELSNHLRDIHSMGPMQISHFIEKRHSFEQRRKGDK